MNKAKVIVSSILITIAVALLGFCGWWVATNWQSITALFNGTKLYTYDQVRESYDNGLNEGINRKEFYENKINDLMQEIEALAIQKIQLQTTVSLLNNQINALTAENAEQFNLIQQLQNTVLNLNNQIEGLNEYILSLESEITKLNGILDTLIPAGDVLVVFFNYNNSVYQSYGLHEGTSLSAIPTSIKNDNEKYFIGWSLDRKNVIDFNGYVFNENTEVFPVFNCAYVDIAYNYFLNGKDKSNWSDSIDLKELFNFSNLNNISSVEINFAFSGSYFNSSNFDSENWEEDFTLTITPSGYTASSSFLNNYISAHFFLRNDYILNYAWEKKQEFNNNNNVGISGQVLVKDFVVNFNSPGEVLYEGHNNYQGYYVDFYAYEGNFNQYLFARQFVFAGKNPVNPGLPEGCTGWVRNQVIYTDDFSEITINSPYVSFYVVGYVYEEPVVYVAFMKNNTFGSWTEAYYIAVPVGSSIGDVIQYPQSTWGYPTSWNLNGVNYTDVSIGNVIFNENAVVYGNYSGHSLEFISNPCFITFKYANGGVYSGVVKSAGETLFIPKALGGFNAWECDGVIYTNEDSYTFNVSGNMVFKPVKI